MFVSSQLCTLLNENCVFITTRRPFRRINNNFYTHLTDTALFSTLFRKGRDVLINNRQFVVRLLSQELYYCLLRSNSYALKPN